MTETSPFFKLPAELRNEIYRHLLAGYLNARTPTIPIASHGIDLPPTLGPDGLEALNLETPDSTKPPRYCHCHCSCEDASDSDSDFDPDEDDSYETPIHTPDMNPGWEPEYQLLQVSRRINEEASAILYNESVFRFDYRLSHLRTHRFLSFGPVAKNLARITTLEIHIKEDARRAPAAIYELEHLLRSLASHATNLQKLDFKIGLRCFAENTTDNELLGNMSVQEVLSAFTVDWMLRFTLKQGTYAPVFGHEMYQRWALGLAEEKGMMVFGTKRVERGMERPTATAPNVLVRQRFWHECEWTLKDMDGEEVEEERERVRGEGKGVGGGPDRFVRVEETLVDDVGEGEGVEPLRMV